MRKRQRDKRKKKNKEGKRVERKGRNNKEFEGEENKHRTMVGRSKMLTVANNALSNTHTTGRLFLTVCRGRQGYIIIVSWKDTVFGNRRPWSQPSFSSL